MNKPEMTNQVAEYRATLERYNKLVGKVNTSYFGINKLSESAYGEDPVEKAIEALSSTNKHLAEQIAAAEEARDLSVVLAEQIATGAMIASAEYDNAVYRWHDLQHAIERAVTLHELAEQKTKEIAFGEKASWTSNVNYKPLRRYYALVNELTYNQVDAQVADYLAHTPMRYIKSRDEIVLKKVAA